MSKNATARKSVLRIFSYLLEFKENPQQHANLLCVREGTSMSRFSNEWHLWVSAKYLIIGSRSVCKDNIIWSAFSLKTVIWIYLVRTTALERPGVWLMPLLTERSRVCGVLFHHVPICMQKCKLTNVGDSFSFFMKPAQVSITGPKVEKKFDWGIVPETVYDKIYVHGCLW